MKTKKRRLIIPFLFLILEMGACKSMEEPRFEFYENHEIMACGVEDPLRNLEWLAEFTEKYREYSELPNYSYGVRIELYSNIETQEEHIVIFINRYWSGSHYCAPLSLYESDQVYYCSGERMGVEWYDFFYPGANISQGIIWYMKRIN